MNSDFSKAELDEVLEKIKNLKTECERLRTENQSFSREVFAQKAELEMIVQAKDELELRLDHELDEEFQAQIKELDAENEIVSRERDQLAKQIAGLEEQLLSSKRENAELQGRIASLAASGFKSMEAQSVIDSLKRALL